MEVIEYVNIGTGLLLILVGWLCYRNPDLINPYGGMPPERKALVDIEGLKKSLAITMAVTGILLIVTALLSIFNVISEIMSVNVMMVLVFAMLVPLFIAMKKYNGFGRDKMGKTPSRYTLPSKVTLVILGMSAVFVVTILALSNMTPKIEVGEDMVSISGMYGRDIPTTEIITVELLEKMPPVKMRTNGSSTHKYNKGHFLLQNGEKCMMFIRHKAPYIELRTMDNLYYLNAASEEETLRLYEQLKSLNP